VAALPPDAAAEPGLDAWLAALEATASPNVLLPHDVTNCADGKSFVHVSWPRAKGVAATELTLSKPEDVSAALDEQGVVLTDELPQAEHYLVWSWPAAATEQTTRTLRVEGGAAPLTLLPGSSFPVLVNAVTRGAVTYPSALDNGDLSVTFVAGTSASSNYREQVRTWFEQRSEPLLEMRARSPLFDWAIYDDSVSLAPLVRSYALRAKDELPGLDADTCTDQLRALRRADAPAASACGEARDASIALSAVGTEQATLQRFVLPGAAGVTESAPGGDPSAPTLRAQIFDDSACPSAPLPPISVQPPARPGGAASGNSAPPPVVVEETTVVNDTSHTDVSCSGSSEPSYYDDQDRERSSCSSDTSSTSESDSSSSDCSGDSSSSSSDSSDDSSCSSDSSSSADSGCGSDSSSSSGYDGDTCTGNAAPDAEPARKMQASLSTGKRARGPRRMKTSLWSLAFAAVVLPIRRRKRGQRTSC
jgi:hypothetical protein